MIDSVKKYIYLIGSNHEVEHEVVTFFSKKKSKMINYEVRILKDIAEAIKEIFDFTPDLIILDFNEENFKESSRPSLLQLIHGYLPLSSIPIVCIFNSEKQCGAHEMLYGFGVSLMHVRGNDMEQFLSNCFYIAYEIEADNQKYAVAKNFNIDFQLESLAYISSFDMNSFSIDTDMDIKSESVIVQMDLYDEFPRLNCNIIESFAVGKYSQTFYHDKLEIPFASAWDEEGQDCLFQDTFESWADDYSEDFLTNTITVLHFSKSKFTLGLVSNISTNSNYTLRYSYVRINKELFKLKPQLIVFEMSDEDSYDELNELMSEITYTEKNFNSIILIYNHNSHSRALRSMYQYDKIIATNQTFNKASIESMISSLEVKSSHEQLQFKDNDIRRCLTYLFDVKITSFSENALTFKTKLEIPYYSVLKLQVPIKMYLLVIPSKINLSPHLDGFHYQAIICGVDASSSEYLRRYVNHLLGKEVDRWEFIDFKKTDEESLTTENLTQENEEKIEKEYESVENNMSKRQRTTNMKSKL
jgi:hypothetical protein